MIVHAEPLELVDVGVVGEFHDNVLAIHFGKAEINRIARQTRRRRLVIEFGRQCDARLR